MADSDGGLLVEQAGDVLRLTLDRPARRNALDDALILALTRAFLQVPGTVRAIVLTGAGDKAFCAGADLSPQAGTFSFDYATPASNYAEMLRAGRKVTVPVIGRINGHCLAGGMGLLAICDMAVAVEGAKFGLPEVKVGLFPMQVAAILKAMLPPRKFAEMCLTGELVTAADALDLGLVNYLAPTGTLDEKVDWLVDRVIDKSPAAIRRGKYALAAMAGMTADQAIAFMEAQAGLMPLTEDAREGTTAFAEKRPPNWTGR